MTRRNKRQEAREKAMGALAAQLAQQKKLTQATEDAFLALAPYEETKSVFAQRLQELVTLGESPEWLRETFELESNELRALLKIVTLEEQTTGDPQSPEPSE